MAPNGTVNPNCPNLSNPYHQCTQACLQKTKGTKPPHANRKSSGYGRSVTDGEVGKKTNGERRTYAGCPKASNPYHKCDQNCHKTLSDSGAAPPNSNFDKTKRPAGSKPKPPVLDSVPASKAGAIYLSGASSPISHYSDNKKVDPKSDDHTLSGPISGPIHTPDVMPVYHKDELIKDGAEHHTNPIGTNQEDKVASHEVVPINTYSDDTGEGVTTVTPAGGSRDFSFSGGSNDEDSCEEGETESVVSESRIPVGKYNVKQSFASILRSILDKYGDIGASCHLESVAMRSYYIECVCFVVHELQSDSAMQLTKSKLDELLAILKDVESANLRVAWLRIALDEIAENIELITHHQDVEAEKAKSDREMESLREQLQAELATLALKEQEVADIKTRIPEIRDRLSEIELKSSELDKSTVSIKSKLDELL